MQFHLSKFLSYCFHPLLLPTWLFGLLFFNTPIFIEFTEKIKIYLLSLICITTLGIPAVLVLVLYKIGFISSIELYKATERRIPMLITSLTYIALYFMLATGVFQGTLLSYLVLCITVSIVIATAITFYYKISIHALGISGLVGLLLALQYTDTRYHLLYLVIGSILAAGMTLSARLSLAAHTPQEVWWGTLVGFVTNFGLLLVLLTYL